MATLSDRPDDGRAGGTPPLSGEEVLCPHCGTLMASRAEVPWPGEPVLCTGCERWVGRGRAVPNAARGQVDAGPNGADAPPASTAAEPGPAASSREDSPPRPSRHRPRRPGPIARRRARDLGPPPVPPASAPSASSEPVPAQENGASRRVRSWEGREPSAAGPAFDPAGSGTDAGGAADPWSRPEGSVEDRDSVGSAEPIEHPGPPADAGHGNGAIRRPQHAGPYPPPPDFDLQAPGGAAEPDGAAPEHTVPFSVRIDEPERRRRFALPRLRRPALRRPTRAGLMRKLPVILVVAGALLLLEGALTVLWKEPFSALFASQVQSALGDDLEAREHEAALEAAKGRRNAVEYMRRRAVSLNRELEPGEAVGRLRIKKIDLSTVVVQSTTEPSLTKGPGHYRETPLPGQKGDWTVGIAGHRTTYDAPFRNIDKLERGDEILFTLPYGRFTYEVEGTRIVDDAYTGAFIPKGYDRIALTACHPLYSAAQRIIAYGKLKESKPRGGATRAAERS